LWCAILTKNGRKGTASPSWKLNQSTKIFLFFFFLSVFYLRAYGTSFYWVPTARTKKKTGCLGHKKCSKMAQIMLKLCKDLTVFTREMFVSKLLNKKAPTILYRRSKTDTKEIKFCVVRTQ